jgi:hypothetical protein
LILEGKGPQSTAYWRGVPSDDTSTNFDLEEVQPFLGRLRRLVDEGFAAEQIASAMTKIKNLQPQTREQIVFPIVFRGAASPFYLGVYMDDVDAPDICFSGPVELVRQIDDDIKKG